MYIMLNRLRGAFKRLRSGFKEPLFTPLRMA